MNPSSFLIFSYRSHRFSALKARPSNIRLTWKTAPEGLGAVRAKVSGSEQHEP
jgi:hypothetical protein